MVCLTEQGLYFFLGRSDKPKALPFQKWLAGEVLPAIRRTGRYVAPSAQAEVLPAFRGYAFRGSAARQREHAQDVPPHPASDGRDPARQDAGGTGAAGGGAVRPGSRHGGDPEGQGPRPTPPSCAGSRRTSSLPTTACRPRSSTPPTCSGAMTRACPPGRSRRSAVSCGTSSLRSRAPMCTSSARFPGRRWRHEQPEPL